MRRTLALAVAGGCLLALTASGAAAANVVENGSLEDLNDRFRDTRCGYMAVPPRSHAITKWTVPPATTGELAWGTRTCDGYTAAKGAFFLDLTGFGAESSNGAIRQTLRTESGTHYRFSIDVCTCNDGTLSVKVGPETLSLSPGSALRRRGYFLDADEGQLQGTEHRAHVETQKRNAGCTDRRHRPRRHRASVKTRD